MVSTPFTKLGGNSNTAEITHTQYSFVVVCLFVYFRVKTGFGFMVSIRTRFRLR